jgi:tryptophan synthase alpha chain
MNRYHTMFEALDQRHAVAFVPFWLLGFPDLKKSEKIIETLIENGADALELGIPFSDPIADGPVIQRASTAALAAGVTPPQCFALIRSIRQRHSELPIGLLLYGNLVLGPGADGFFGACADAGVDSVLLADIPLRERHSVSEQARKENIALVQILPPDADQATIEAIASLSEAYVYIVSQPGVTGGGSGSHYQLAPMVERLKALGGAPAIQGFGIKNADDALRALAAPIDGIICGSALIELAFSDKPERNTHADIARLCHSIKKSCENSRAG